jgi:hypothetical protein
MLPPASRAALQLSIARRLAALPEHAALAAARFLAALPLVTAAERPAVITLLRRAGYVGVIGKATQGPGMTDKTYRLRRLIALGIRRRADALSLI